MTEGRRLRDEGMELAESAEDTAYKAAFLAEGRRQARTAADITSETITAIVGRPTHPNVVGSLMRQLARQGYLVEHGYAQAERADRHASRMLVWRGTERAQAKYVAVVGSRDTTRCSCDAQDHHWPPTPEERVHRETCFKYNALRRAQIIMDDIVKRGEATTILSTGSLEGADYLLRGVAEQFGLPVQIVKAKPGQAPFWERMGPKLVDKADVIMGMFRPDEQPTFPAGLVELAKTKGIKICYWQKGWHIV